MNQELINAEANRIVKNLLYEKRLTFFSLNEQAIKLLENDDLPKPILLNLTKIKNNKYANEEKFKKILVGTIGEADAAKYEFLLLKHTKSKHPDFNQRVDKYAELFSGYVNKFIENPASSIVSLDWITNTVALYAGVDPVNIADHFFEKINLAELTGIYQYRSMAFLKKYLEFLTTYFRKKNYVSDMDETIHLVYREIDLKYHADSINEKLQETYTAISRPGFTSVNESTLLRSLCNIARCFFTASNLALDPKISLEIRVKVKELYDQIDFMLLGKVVEYKKRELGNISSLLEMMKKSKCENSSMTDFLSEIDFYRLAHSYNQNPGSRAAVANFYKKYSKTKTLTSKWKIFFQTIDLRAIGDIGYTDLGFLFSAITRVFPKYSEELRNKASVLDFEIIGQKARGKDNIRSFDAFLRNLLKLNLSSKSYGDFIRGFGIEDVQNYSGINNGNLKKIIQKAKSQPE